MTREADAINIAFVYEVSFWERKIKIMQRRSTQLSGAMFILLLTGLTMPSRIGAEEQPCACGPDFCLNDSRYPKILSAKKDQMKKDGYPAEMIQLMDRDGACVACIERAPDGFTILLVTPGGSQTVSWTKHDEDIARNDLMRGNLTAFYKYNVRRTFSCCGQPKYDARPDWDANLELNRNLVIACTKTGNTATCK